jgi:hypothetical protein
VTFWIEIDWKAAMESMKISHLALVRAVQGGWTLVDDGAMFERSRSRRREHL